MSTQETEAIARNILSSISLEATDEEIESGRRECSRCLGRGMIGDGLDCVCGGTGDEWDDRAIADLVIARLTPSVSIAIAAALAAQRRETIEECAKHCDERAIAYGRSCSVASAEQRHEDASRNALPDGGGVLRRRPRGGAAMSTQNSNSGIVRYEYSRDPGGACYCDTPPAPDGEFVRYSDHLAVLAAQRRETIEECAKVCAEISLRNAAVDSGTGQIYDTEYSAAANDCATALRSLLAPDAKEAT